MVHMIPHETAGRKPEGSLETVFLSAVVQAPAGTVAGLATELAQHDLSPAAATIFNAVVIHAQDIAQTNAEAVMNLPVIHAALSAQGAFHGQDNGTRALLNEVATTPADPIHIPQLVAAVKQQSWRRALAAFQYAVAEIDPETIGTDESDQLIQHALNAYQQARQRLETTTPTTKAGIHIAAA